MKKGTARLYLLDIDGNMHGIYLQNGLYASSYKQSISSVQVATERGDTIDFSSDKALLATIDRTNVNIKKKDGLYHLNKCKADSVKKWIMSLASKFAKGYSQTEDID